ncbi:MAG: type IV toxin-antitoxin system AbiEi family antitoxin domain-containing protein [Nitrospirota bacterium]|jgi:predicted transcriptional regulator of viral defense system
MKTIEFIKALERLNKPFYTIPDIEKITGQSRKSLFVALKRLVERGVLERMGSGIYRLYSTLPSIERVAASLYMPNYLSFESALSRYGILTLIPYTLTFATTRKTKRFTVEGRDIEFRQIKRDLFWGYEMREGIYVARPEKAFLDLIYFVSRGKSAIDLDEIDMGKLSITKLRRISKKYPVYTKRYLTRILV